MYLSSDDIRSENTKTNVAWSFWNLLFPGMLLDGIIMGEFIFQDSECTIFYIDLMKMSFPDILDWKRPWADLKNSIGKENERIIVHVSMDVLIASKIKTT